MKLTKFNINQYLDICVGSVEQIYEAYYRQKTWSFIKRMLSLALAFGRTLKIWVAIMQSKSLEPLDLRDGNYFYFINTGSYVSESFITFLESRNDMLLGKFCVRDLCNSYINAGLKLKKKSQTQNIWIESFDFIRFFKKYLEKTKQLLNLPSYYQAFSK